MSSLCTGSTVARWQEVAKVEATVECILEHLNVRTGYVLPQFHCVYDNLFSTVPSVENGGLFNDDNPFDVQQWNALLETGYERRYEVERDVNGNQLSGPTLQEEWLAGPELQT